MIRKFYLIIYVLIIFGIHNTFANGGLPYTNNTVVEFNKISGEKITDISGDNISVDSNYVYFRNTSDSNKVYRVSKDGTGLTKLADISVSKIILKNGILYFFGGGSIYKVNIDGTGLTNIYNYNWGLSDIVVDDTYIYFREVYNLSRINIDGTGLIGLGNVINNMRTDNDYLYTTNINMHSIFQRVVKGGNTLDIIGSAPNTNFPNIELDDTYIYLYSGGNIYKMPKSGGSFTSIIGVNANFLLPYGNNLYFSNGNDGGKIYKVGKDGTGLTKITDVAGSNGYIYNNDLYFSNGGNGNKIYKVNISSPQGYNMDDGTYISDKISNSNTGVYIKANSTLPSGTDYDFYIGSLYNYTSVYPEGDGMVEVYGNEYDNWNCNLGGLGINSGDSIILYKGNNEISTIVTYNDGCTILVSDNITGYDSGYGIKKQIPIYQKVSKEFLGGNKELNLISLLGGKSGYLYYKIILNTTNNSTTPIINSVNIYILNQGGDSNGDSSTYILNQLDGNKGNMQFLNNNSSSTAFSNYLQVKSNFLANYSYMQSWYEAKGLTLDVINNNIDWNNGVTFSKTDVAGGMLNGYKLSAHYPFLSYKETDNNDSSITWRTNLESTSFQTDTTWAVGVPAYPIRNGSGGIIAYLEFPCGNLICKDQYCSDVKKIINPTPINPIHETVFADPGNRLPYCGDNIKNTMDEECDGNDGIRHDLGETCSAQCKVVVGGNTPGCPSYSALGFSCNGSVSTPIFNISTQTPPGGGTGTTNTGTTVINTGSIINWTPPGNITIPVVGDINTNTGMTDTEKTISDDVVCNSTNNGTSLNKSIVVTNSMADTTFLRELKGKTEFLKTLSGSSTDVADKIIQKKLKAEKLNEKSSTYDLGAGGNISGIQFNLTKIPNSAIMRKLVDLAIDHSSTTMADYEQTVVDSCNGTITSTGTMVIPAGFINVNEKGETILNLFRFNGE